MGRNMPTSDKISATISGTVTGPVAVGKDIQQTVSSPSSYQASQDELASLRQALAELRQQVTIEAPTEKIPAALERVDELEEAINSKEPDLTTMEYVKGWFARNLPGLAGAVMGVIVHPIVGKLVEATGDALVAEFQRRFGV
jgi:hypothetical protein